MHHPTDKNSTYHEPRKRNTVSEEGIVLFNDTLNTFYLRLYGIGHMVKKGRKGFI